MLEPELPTFIGIISFGSVACPERYKRSVATIYEIVVNFGGLKRTRTSDLTLIRRAL